MAQASNVVRVAVIGAGDHGTRHAREFLRLEGAELVGVYDVRFERASRLAAELGLRAFASLDETLEDVQAVSVVIPATNHARVARQAFNRGVDVLLEKPITRTLEEADELVRCAAQQGRI